MLGGVWCLRRRGRGILDCGGCDGGWGRGEDGG